MKFLAINTAVDVEILLCSDKDYYFVSHDKTMASAVLLAQIEELLSQADTSLERLDFFACVTGPGSFTGLRIGVSTVRAFAYALNKSVLPVTYFDVLAYNTMPQHVAVNAGAGLSYLRTLGQSPICVKNQDLPSGEIVGDSLYTHQITKAGERGAHALKSAVLSALKTDGLVSFDKLVPLYLRKSQPERGEGDL